MNVYEPDFDKNSLKAVDLAQQAEAAKLARQREQAALVQAGNADLLEISQFLGHSGVGVTQVYTSTILDDPGDPGGAAAATAFRVARKRGRPRAAAGEQPALFDPDEKPKRGKRK